MNYLAQRTQAIDASGIRKVFALAAKLKDPVNFSIGLPDFDVPQTIKDSAIEAIQAGHNRYSQTAGDEQLKAKLTETIESEYNWQDPSVLVTSGVSGSLLLSFMALVNPGDEIIIPDPYFVIYKHLINMLGGKCVFIDTYPDFKLPVQRIEDAITEKTKLIIVNSPANPTGVVYDEAELKELAQVAKRHDVIVMSDEIYDKFSYDQPCASIANHYEKTILLKGFSKSYAMTGWRMAYAATNKALEPLLNEMAKIQQYTFVCAPTPFQKAAITAVDTDITSYVDAYRAKRNAIYNGLKGKFEIAKPAGAFYAFVKAPNANATEFVKRAIENNVLIIPGNVFSEQDSHFRISYATTDEKIAQGIDILNSLA